MAFKNENYTGPSNREIGVLFKLQEKVSYERNAEMNQPANGQ